MKTDTLTQARIAENQATFREANEQIESTADAIHLDVDVPFICECAEPTCTQIVPLSLEVYEEIRSHPRRFFNVPGHQDVSVRNGAGVVVAREEGYVLVDKVGIAGELAEEHYSHPSE
jgi:hypothetical protein